MALTSGVTRNEADPGRSVAIAALVVSFIVAAVQITAHLVDYGVYHLRIEALNSNLGHSAVAWVSPVALLASIAGSILLVARLRPRSTLDFLLPPMLALLLVEMILHERDSVPHWQVAFALPLGVILVLLIRTGLRTQGASRRCIMIGCGLLVLSFACHVVGGPLLSIFDWGANSWPYQIKVAVKEAAEITGWIFIAAGLFGAARMEALGASVD